jgi:F-type H+-transporting ATPase subunit b
MINFLVLVWILKHFLYKPVLGVLAKRRQGIESQLTDAKQLREEAETLKQQYEGRLADWEHERQQARDKLAQEIDSERQQQMSELKDTLEQEKQKAEVIEKRRQAEALHKTEQRALQQAAEFASRLLSQASGPELETRLVALFITQLADLSKQQKTELKSQWGETPEAIQITTAFPLSDQQQQELQQHLQEITGEDTPIQFAENPELLAGLHIAIGAWALHANVRDDLKGFAEFAYATR